MACALLLSWWHWVNLYWLGSEKHVYSVTLSNIFKLDSYGHVPVIYNILSHNIPSNILRLMHIWSIGIYFFKPKTTN